MNIDELKIYKDTRRLRKLTDTIYDLDQTIKFRAERGIRNSITRHSNKSYDDCDYVEDWLIDELAEHYKENGFKVTVSTEKAGFDILDWAFSKATGEDYVRGTYRKITIEWDI